MSQSADHQFLDKACMINQLLPVEILTMILLFVGPPSFKKPYVYLRLSWVCRRWRSIVLDHPKFWSVLGHHDPHDTSFAQEVILRSKSSQLDVFSCPDQCDRPLCISRYITSECSRIRTLLFRDRRFFGEDTTDWSALSFPQLENLIFPAGMHYLYSPDIRTVENLFFRCRPRYVEISCPLYKWMSQGLSHVEWLKLDYEWPSSGEISIIHNILQNLPSLKILNLISNKSPEDIGTNLFPRYFPDQRAITLPNLRMLSLDIGDGQFCSIRAPTLDYFGASCFSLEKKYDWHHLNSVDLSMTKYFRIALDELQPRRQYHWDPPNPGLRIACISTGTCEDDCELFENFHARISKSGEVLDTRFMRLPPKNSFHVSFDVSEKFERVREKLFLNLTRATNLVEITLDYRRHVPSSVFQSFLTQVLTTFDTVVSLTILRGRSFVAVCTLLMNGRTVPRLERLTYHSSWRIYNTDFIVNRMKMMQDARSEASCRPLKSLELRNFVAVRPECVEDIRGLGIELIQKLP